MMQQWLERWAENARGARRYLAVFFKWAVVAAACGAVCGAVGAAFYHAVALATSLRTAHPWLLFLLPAAGLAIVGLYHLAGVLKDEGTNLILASIHTDRKPPLRMAALIFTGTALTHLCGGSSGREGAALQIGGSLGNAVAARLHLDDKDHITLTMCGMSAVFCAVFGFAGSLVSLFISKWMAKMTTGTQIITQPRTRHEQWLLQTVEELSREAGIKMPEVGIFPAYEANAFATGWNRNDALVAVSQGLLERFSPDEVRAVLAHEIGHVANGDMVTLALVQGVVNTFVMFCARIIGNFVDKVIFKNEEGQGIAYYVATIVAELVLGILASMIVMWFSRRREYRADEAGAQLAGTSAMIGALQRLRVEQGLPVHMPDTLKAFGINGGLKHGLAGLLMSHPPLEDRIEALRRRG